MVTEAPIVAAPVFNGGEAVQPNEHRQYWDTYFDLYDDPNAVVNYPDKSPSYQEPQIMG